ncbi:SIMPL domain-containing protein [Priestia taiwanensis]|uniref:SIMPL domain-containing protein n=1 Tax=Priestia taiwanensis TaxID=1347902 RepID=A0A917ENZ8_9BACI|nr:SIMPL domain-containing protein [Priestia taiwanensis]MBM7363274.1 uncharacterized protein YggE [Priestia taiwanensis]GGE69067.1 SIMPL domain-containing protein [Priestia taiwanensis]
MQYGYQSPQAKQYDRTMMVIGEGKISVLPDTVSLTVGVLTENKNIKKAQEENADKANAMRTALTRSGLSEDAIETKSYRIQPKYELKDGTSQIAGYEVQQTFEITVPNVQKAGEVYDIAMSNGANIAHSLTFSTTESAAYYLRALTLAVQDAREKAFSLATASGMTIHQIPVLIQEEPPNLPHAISYSESVPTLKASTTISPRDIEIAARINVTYAYYTKSQM